MSDDRKSIAEYQRVLRGEVEPVPEVLYDQIQHLPDWRRRLDRAVQAIWEDATLPRRGRERAWLSASEVLDLIPGITPKEHHRMLSLALEEAKMSTRYWGVVDPEAESYCFECRTVKPLADFSGTPSLCQRCRDERPDYQ